MIKKVPFLYNNMVMIQWFPGHMAKAIRQIKEKESLADLFIVVLDARAPISSYNEEFDAIGPTKPRSFVITKIDLADTSKLTMIKDRFNHESDSVIIADLTKNKFKKMIMKEAEKLLEPKRQRDIKKGLLHPRLRAIVVGVPNSGKSTLINLLASTRATKVGNMPGVTKGQQWVNVGKMHLLDTPGILWPKFENELTGIKLAIIGSIKTDIVPLPELFNEMYKLISKSYPNKLFDIGLEAQQNEVHIYANLIKLCKSRSFLVKGGKADTQKGMTWFKNYIRDMKGVTYD